MGKGRWFLSVQFGDEGGEKEREESEASSCRRTGSVVVRTPESEEKRRDIRQTCASGKGDVIFI